MSATIALTPPALRLRAQFCEPSGRTVAAGDVALGRECAAFRLWIDDLPAQGNDALMQLRGCGFAYDLASLKEQLLRALRDGPAGPLARIVGQRVLSLLSTHPDAICFFLEEG